MRPALERTAFTFSRELEFFTEAELRAQIGYARDHWPLAILRELIDNALDAADAKPDIKVEIDERGFTVADNGPGIAADTIRQSLDYSIRVSDKAAYVAPTRGAMGNALKVTWAAPFVDTGKGRAVVYSRGTVHRIDIKLDRIRQQPDIRYRQREVDVKNGTIVRIHWPDSARQLLQGEDAHFLQPSAFDLIADYAAFNPHASFTINGQRFDRTAEQWNKWRTTDPTPPAWYSPDTLRNLIAAYLASDDEKTVREFVSEFKGLSSTGKQKAVGYARDLLADHVADGDVDQAFVETLLQRMQATAKPPKPSALGVIGKTHMSGWMNGVSGESLRYKKASGDDGMPYVVEVAFGVSEDMGQSRRMAVGLNWSPTIGARPSNDISEALATAMIEPHDPVVLAIHITRPRFEFADRGKTRISMSPTMASDAADAIRLVTKNWTTAKRKDARQERISERRWREMQRQPNRTTVRKAAFEIMETAFNHASNNGQYLANARQIYYAARPFILEQTDDTEVSDQYFTQTLLKDYILAFDPAWAAKVVWDARGNLIEPHTGKRVSLGGADVSKYMSGWLTQVSGVEVPAVRERITTAGPRHRYSSALFIEKEGFTEILQHSGIPERFDMAIMSTKGVPVDACCRLINRMEADGVQVFALHDFDPAGFKIAKTLREGTRLTGPSNVIDIGLRFGDIDGLQDEPFEYKQKRNPALYLRKCGATDDEISLLVQHRVGGYTGRRVEINAMTSDQLVAFLEAKFEAEGVRKVIPGSGAMADAYRRAAVAHKVQSVIDSIIEDIEIGDIPDNLVERVESILAEMPRLSWDEAVWTIAGAQPSTSPPDYYTNK